MYVTVDSQRVKYSGLSKAYTGLSQTYTMSIVWKLISLTSKLVKTVWLNRVYLASFERVGVWTPPSPQNQFYSPRICLNFRPEDGFSLNVIFIVLLYLCVYFYMSKPLNSPDGNSDCVNKMTDRDVSIHISALQQFPDIELVGMPHQALISRLRLWNFLAWITTFQFVLNSTYYTNQNSPFQK